MERDGNGNESSCSKVAKCVKQLDSEKNVER